jgi:hypothetical protein
MEWKMNLTIDQVVTWLIVASLILGVSGILAGSLQIRTATKLRYFLLRRKRIMTGWRWLLVGGIALLFGLVTMRLGRQVAYRIIPPTASVTPSPTITLTPSITPTPTITLTPTITPTGTITPTATVTPTPELPQQITLLIRETQQPPAEAAFSPPIFSKQLNRENQPINPQEDFQDPSGRIYGAFTYNNLLDGMRWTAIWHLGAEVVCLETQIWDGGTGGYGYTECERERWAPGEYEVQIFFGERWMISSRFEVLPPIASKTPTP